MKAFCQKFLQLLVLLLLLSSCNSYKKVAYLQQQKGKNDSIFVKIKSAYKLQPADQLYVKVKCNDESVNQLFNMDLGATSTSMTSLGGGSMYLMSYSIDNSGFINLPVIGKVLVGGTTLDEAKVLVEQKANEYIKEARIDVKLVSFKVSVLGEVKSPGQQTVMNDDATVFEVIARAGDLTYYSNRKKVYIIRSFEKEHQVKVIDITNRNILASKDFYLMPNDVVYVEPQRMAALRINISDYSTIISTISSSLALILLIVNLSKSK